MSDPEGSSRVEPVYQRFLDQMGKIRDEVRTDVRSLFKEINSIQTDVAVMKQKMTAITDIKEVQGDHENRIRVLEKDQNKDLEIRVRAIETVLSEHKGGSNVIRYAVVTAISAAVSFLMFLVQGFVRGMFGQ